MEFLNTEEHAYGLVENDYETVESSSLGQTEASLSDSDESKTSSYARDKIITVGDVKQQ